MSHVSCAALISSTYLRAWMWSALNRLWLDKGRGNQMNVWALQLLLTLTLYDTSHQPCTNPQEHHLLLCHPLPDLYHHPLLPAFVAVTFYGLLQFAHGMSSLAFPIIYHNWD